MNFIWRSPSNIALVKYWGKHGRQLPRNASISFTLSNAYSETALELLPRQEENGISLSFLFEGIPNEVFERKLIKLLTGISDIFPFLTQYHLKISSHNTFPHSAGIASSASAMSALACCLCDAERHLMGTLQNEADFFQKASFASRLLSGSACRSVFPILGVWGQHDSINGSGDEFAVPFKDMHPVYRTFHDDILIISADEKKVSSTAGHELMNGNPFAPARYEQAATNLAELSVALKNGDLETFGRITEEEALTLHALMMTSRPSYILLEPQSLAAIDLIREFRFNTKVPLYFSIDAGPNLHLLYPHEHIDIVSKFIDEQLRPLCQDGRIVKDIVGEGATKVA